MSDAFFSPAVTVTFGGLSASLDRKLPGWTTPFVVRLAETIAVDAANAGADPVLVVRDGEALVVDRAPDAFAREFGSLEAPARPALLPALARARAGGAP